MRDRSGTKADRRGLLSLALANRPVLVVAAFGVVLTLLAAVALLREEQDNRNIMFIQEANLYLTSIQRSIDRSIEVLDSVKSLFSASVEVTRDEFDAFAQRALARHHEIQALEYIPHVTARERPMYEARARRDGYAGFAFREMGVDGVMKTSDGHDEYFPVFYMYPVRGNESALGFDLASETTRFAVLTRARESGEMMATPPITLVQEAGDQYGFLVFNPIMGKQDSGMTKSRFQGFALGVFRVNDMINNALLNLRIAGLHFVVSDNSSSGGDAVLADYTEEGGTVVTSNHTSPALPQGDLRWRGTLNISDRAWHLDFFTDSHYSTPYRPLKVAALVIAVGFSFTLLVVFYMVSAAHNTDRAVRLVSELEKTSKGLETRNRDLEDFAYMVAHDLRTPLVSIHGFLELLAKSLDQDLNEQQEWIVERISANLTHFDDLLGDLLQYSRIGNGALERDRLEFKTMVDRIVLENREEIKRRQGRVKLQEDLPPIYLNGTRFYQLISNLVSNGLKFQRPGAAPEVEIGMIDKPDTEIPPGHGLFFIRDNGIGIDKANRDNVFRLFFQADKEKFPGSGAGLAIVKRIIEQESGKIWVESSPGQGTTVFFSLPV